MGEGAVLAAPGRVGGMRKLFETYDSGAQLILRVMLGW